MPDDGVGLFCRVGGRQGRHHRLFFRMLAAGAMIACD
jgi:hypothetical protein